MNETSPKVTAYLKTYCGWSAGVRAILHKYGLEFEEKDILKNPAFRWEMEHRSGQSLSPCVEIDGHMLADVSGADLESWLICHGHVLPDDSAAEASINSSCSHEVAAITRLPMAATIRSKV